MIANAVTAGTNQYWRNASLFDAPDSLLSYVPETAWNEDAALKGLASSSGGSSSYFPRPSWQIGVPGIPSGQNRLLPDIALQSSVKSPGVLFCTDDPTVLAADGETGSCGDDLRESLASGTYTVGGGTSFAAPFFAGLVAILNQTENTAAQGNINPELYTLASSPSTYASVFHDINSGTNACAAGMDNCQAAGQSGFAAGSGYDEATGLGSIDFGNLLKAWPASGNSTLYPTGTGVSGTCCLPAIITPGTNIALIVSTSPSIYAQGALPPATPTGTISVSLDGGPSIALPISPVPQSYPPQNASATTSVVAPASTGTHIVTAIYSGDAVYAGSKQIYPLMIGSATPSGSFNLAVNNLTIPNGSTGTTTLTVTPANGYTGRLAWSLSATGTTSATLCVAISPVTVNGEPRPGT